MSTVSPKRNPSRMPCFTQVLTRQPVGDARIALGRRARRRRSSAARSSANAARAAALVRGRAGGEERSIAWTEGSSC